MAHSIPLGKFPYVVVAEILKSMQTMEILNLCQVSRKSKEIVLSIIKTNNYGIKVVRQRRSHCVAFGNLETRDESKFIIIQYEYMEIQNRGEAIVETWVDPDQGLMNKISLLADALNIKNALFDFEGHTPQDESRLLRIAEHARSEGLAFKSIRMCGNFYLPTVFEYFLEHSDEQSEMILQSYSSHVYRFEINYKLGKIKIENAKMVNLFALGSFLNCAEVTLEKCSFSAEATRGFLKSWQQRANSKMKRLEFKQSDVAFTMDLEWVLDGFDAQIVRQKVMNNGVTLQFQPKQAYRIQRKDGVGFTVSYVNRTFTMISD